MVGPLRRDPARTMWIGVQCSDCGLRSACTDGRSRTLTVDLELERLRAAMRQRVEAPGGRKRYNRRIATIEPVFSNIESAMGYRRASSRVEDTILAEILMKVFVHNVSRMLGSGMLSRALCLITPDGYLVPLWSEFQATL